jgi:hypothetical protein
VVDEKRVIEDYSAVSMIVIFAISLLLEMPKPYLKVAFNPHLFTMRIAPIFYHDIYA